MNEHALFWLHGTAKRALMFWRQRSHCECRLLLCGTVIDKVLSGRWRDISAGKTVTRAVDLPHMSSYITRLIQPPPLPLFRGTLAWTLILILPKKKKTAVNPCTLTEESLWELWEFSVQDFSEHRFLSIEGVCLKFQWQESF